MSERMTAAPLTEGAQISIDSIATMSRRPSQHPTVRPPPMPTAEADAYADTTAVPRSSRPDSMRIGFPAPQFSAPRTPQPFTVPVAPVTRRMLPEGDEQREHTSQRLHVRLSPNQEPHVDLAPTSRRPLTAPTLPAHETPSLAPVAMPGGKSSFPPARPSRAAETIQLRSVKAPRSSMITTAVALLLAGLVAGFVVGIAALVPGGLGKGWAGASSLIDRAKGKPAAAKPSAAASSPRPIVSANASASTAPTVVPPVSMDSAQPPREPIEPDQTLVTFPPSAKNHRIFVDGRPNMTGGSTPMKIKCGKHKIQIGSEGKPQPYHLPCGGELTLD